MINSIIAKILSELTLSTYPVFIKIINIPFVIKILYRFFAFCLISLFFCDLTVLKKYLLNKDGLLLSLYTLIHVFSSYKGFELLNGGVASSILYIYPLIILYLNNKKYILIYLFILCGLILLSFDHIIKENNQNNQNTFLNYTKGFSYMFVSAVTEALIYFSVLNIKTTNNWNHIFISYFFGLIIIFFYYFIKHNKINNIIKEKELFIIDKKNMFFLLFNIFVALFGYYLRFYSIDKLNHKLYAILSYLGIFMTYFYSYLFNNEKITYLNFIGSLIIIISNIYLLFQPNT